MTQVSTKLFRLDLGYFRKNFLNQETWGENHLLYENSTIRVELQQYSIITSEQELHFRVKVKVIDDTYFTETFGTEGNISGRSGDSGFTVPINNKEYTEEVFVKQVYGAFKAAYSGAYGCFWGYRQTAIISQIQKKRANLTGILRVKAKAIYIKEQADEIKKYINEETFVNHYLSKNETYKEIREIESGLDNNAARYLAEKDTKLFCDFIGLEYTPAEEIEKYEKLLETAKDYLK